MRWIWCIMMSAIYLIPGFAQAQKDDRAKHIEAVKAAFITQKLDLTTQEAQNFWPVYNTYQKELKTLYDQKKQNRAALRNNPNKQLDDEFMYEERILELKKKYRKRFAKILPAQKIVLLYQAEREFREKLIKQLKERKH